MALDPTIPRWPDFLFGDAAALPTLFASTIQGPQPLVGPPQSVAGPGYWRMQLADVPVYGPRFPGDVDRIATYRVLAVRLAQGLPVLVPLFDRWRGPRARLGGADRVLTTHDDATRHSDATPYQNSPDLAALAVPALARATELTVDASGPAVAAAGDFFSIDDRAYLILSAFPDDAIAGRWLWRIAPELRYEAAIGTVLEIDDPVCRMTLDSGDRGRLLVMQGLRIGRETFNFSEAVWA